MKHTEALALKLQTDSILNSFKASGKRHLLITGARGSGKSTLLSKIAKPHVTTRCEKGVGIFMTDDSGRCERIGFFDSSIESRENRMGPDTEMLNDFGASALLRLCSGDGFAVIDEIGYIESSSPEYIRALKALFDARPVIAAVRKQETQLICELKNRDDVFTVDLDLPAKGIGCVIMASGMGRRFGENKLMASFRGRPMIEWVLDATDDIFEKRIVVTRHPEVAELAKKHGIEYILHELPHKSDTVRLGISQMAETDSCMFIAGDQPMITRESVYAMAMLSADKKEKIVRASFEDTVGTPVVFPKWTYSLLKSLPEGAGGSHVIKAFPEKIINFPVGDAKELTDIDTKDQLDLYDN